MKNITVNNSKKRIINFLFWITLISGITWRFSYLDVKVFWHDEIYTELRVSGYKNIDPYNARLGKILSKKELLFFQGVSKEKKVKDTLSSLSEDVHTPLYFILLKFWQEIWGNSITAIRSLSAVFGVLSLPALYLLIRQLFESEEAAKITTSILAVSPMFIRYSQDARPYSLWILNVTVSTYLLILAIKKDSNKNWFYYAVSIAVTSYCQLLSFYIYMGHFLYVLATKKRKSKTMIKYSSASVIGVILFLPWVIYIIIPKFASMKAQTAWLKISIPLQLLFEEQLANLNHLLFSVNFNNFFDYSKYIIAFIIICLIIHAVYFTIIKNDIDIWLLPAVFSLSSVIFIYQDLMGGQRTRINQYFLPTYIAIFIVIGFTFFYKIFSHDLKQSRWWIAIYCLLITFASITNYQTGSKNTWWGWSSFEVDMAKIINRSDNPLVISQERIGNIMPLFYMLKENSRTLMLDNRHSSLPKGIENSDVFLLNPSPEIREIYEKLSNRSLDVVYQYQEGMINTKLYISK